MKQSEGTQEVLLNRIQNTSPSIEKSARVHNAENIVIRGKAKKEIHARYPFLGGGTYQPPMLSVLYLQVGH